MEIRSLETLTSFLTCGKIDGSNSAKRELVYRRRRQKWNKNNLEQIIIIINLKKLWDYETGNQRNKDTL